MTGLPRGGRQERAEEKPEADFFAPDFTLPDVNGVPVTLSGFRGKKAVFLNLWASWCSLSQDEIRTMEMLYRRFKDRGLEIVAVSVDEKEADVLTFVREHGVTFPVLLALGPVSKVPLQYRVFGIPAHYFIDKNGIIRSREVGAKHWDDPETWKVIEGLLR